MTAPISKLGSIPALLLSVMVVACGGGGGDEAPASPVASPPDLVSAYVGRWAQSCYVRTAPGTDSSLPEGLSEDEVLTITKVDEKTYTATSVTGIYNNAICSTHTSNTILQRVLFRGEIITAVPSASGPIDQVILTNTESGIAVKALMQAKKSYLLLTRATQAGVTVDGNGYPTILDTTRQFTPSVN